MPDGQAGRKQKMLAGTGLPARRETITGRYGVDMTRSVWSSRAGSCVAARAGTPGSNSDRWDQAEHTLDGSPLWLADLTLACCCSAAC